jgi:hypothetical protein
MENCMYPTEWSQLVRAPEATMLIARLAQVDYGTSAKNWEDNHSETNWEHRLLGLPAICSQQADY